MLWVVLSLVPSSGETREPQLGRGWISFCNILVYSPGLKMVLCFNTNIELDYLFSLKNVKYSYFSLLILYI